MDNHGTPHIKSHVIPFYDKQQAKAKTEVISQWYDALQQGFYKDEISTTTILHGGLTKIHDHFFGAGLRSFGFKTQLLNCPDKHAMQTGKEFGNRGQCNPTYFTVGNLINHLQHLRDVKKLPTEDIIKNYIFLTAGSCGPCRFGMYSTEYRKALRDAGFDGFRVISIQQIPGNNNSGKEQALHISINFFRRMLSYFIAADVVNLMGYRIRPYELNKGDADQTLEQSCALVSEAIIRRKSITRALKQCRNLFKTIRVNKLQIKPKVAIIGEFWAMTTEGEGNYQLQRFLESEDAECDIQPITNWMLYMLWTLQNDARNRYKLEKTAISYKDTSKQHPLVTGIIASLGKYYISNRFYHYAKAIGLENYSLSNMTEIANLANQHYCTDLRGGEGHMEVGKLISTFSKSKAHLVISVKPFGCMPSSGVSDGIQSLINKQYPAVNFLPIETSGDGAVNVYSRIQMALFKSRINAKNEFDSALESKKLDLKTANQHLENEKRFQCAINYPKHKVAGSAANLIYQL